MAARGDDVISEYGICSIFRIFSQLTDVYKWVG